MPPSPRKFSTRAVHSGERLPPGSYTPVVTPIHLAASFVYSSMTETDAVLGAEAPGYIYGRYGSPTVAAFETAVADLEGGAAAHAFSSGMAALHVALLAAGVRSGALVLAAYDLYGATFSLLRGLLRELGAVVTFVDACDLAQVEAELEHKRPALLLVETISNPLMRIANIPRLADLARDYGACLLVDNTFASPYLFRPLEHGADYVIHSATKYLSGHGDVTAGVVVTSAENRKKLFELNKLVGSVLGPFEAWLSLRGLKTLPLRVCQQSQNALRIAEYLSTHPRITHVNYPGLVEHPGHTLAEHLFDGRGYGGVLSFEIAGAGKANIFRFMEALQLCLPATTLGDIYSEVLHPATASHRSLSEAERKRIGIPQGLVRLSAGIEDVEDILDDLSQALDE